ncbi:transmembrane protein 94 [Elysia marginata]|uniref:Transmembrane protein 94 n=1 Tax=Elysia marginata TaxID=1093978 RepID=A0AAV4HK48_9GAST|nr:transmembrane protein 94 [Elysia marginata]
MAFNLCRFLYLDEDGGHWAEFLIVLQVHGVLPLLPILLPGLWSLVNTFGQEYIFEAYNLFGSSQDLKDSTESIGSCSTISVEDTVPKIQWRRLLHSVWSSFIGIKGSVCPDFEMLHALGSVTVMCCVDKKGILSWPNPSAEKVLFFSSALKPRQEEEEENSEVNKEERRPERRKKRSRQESDPDARCAIEVLDVTPDSGKDAFSLLFDDPRWKDHIAALKPLGLDILLNTCNENTSEWYTQFTDHVACAARENKETVAVVGRRCLCSLSKEMGFTDDAVNVFCQEAILGAYRQVPEEEAEREKQNRARSFIQHKIPMPNQVSVVARDKLTGFGQLMTQGTGDLVLDCCTDAWTGADLHLLSELDRKRILDFYHRNSMVAYCTAFAYKPLPRASLEWPEHVYTELVESPSTTKVAHGEDVGVFLDGDESETLQRQRSHSVDSLLELSPASSVEELRVGQMLQSHQTFLGMISLQYQARQDFVTLISKLESACIKFVHFSKENEVRSRVFAEKMGLEAGWNCHVSLMPGASEPVSSANSSSRNLSSLGQHPTSAPAGDGDGPAAEVTGGQHPTSAPAGDGDGPAAEVTGGFFILVFLGNVAATVGSTAVPAQPGDAATIALSAGSPMSLPRVQSAPSVVNMEGSQVKFAKNPLPIVYDHESATENSLLLANPDPEDSSSTRPKPSSSNDNVNSVLTSQKTEEDETVQEWTGLLPSAEDSSSAAAESSETALLLRRSSGGASGKKRQQHPSGESNKVSSAPKAEGEGRQLSSADEDSDDEGEDEEEEFDVHSDSRCTSSYVTENTEDSLTGALDNRAHLPRGIENIRPHLKNVDNVPLLVNLFTDCVPEATQEMIKIMQENGEVVLVVGSSLNVDNTSIFLQGDCSIAVEPLYPQLCARRPVRVQPWGKEDLCPTQLASRALALPCPLFFQRNDNIKLVELIMESRHFTLALRNSFYLMLCCSLTLVLSQLLCCLLQLPPPLAVQHELWLVCVLVPALSLSLMGNPNEARTLSMATHKNINIVNRQNICRGWESNLRPTDHKSNALTTKPRCSTVVVAVVAAAAVVVGLVAAVVLVVIVVVLVVVL